MDFDRVDGKEHDGTEAEPRQGGSAGRTFLYLLLVGGVGATVLWFLNDINIEGLLKKDEGAERVQQAQAHVLAGNRLARQKHYDEAIAEFTEAIRLLPLVPEPRLARCNVYYQMREYEKALADVSAAIKLRPDDPHSLAHRAQILVQMKDYEKAIDDFRTVVKLQPNDPQSLNSLAWFLAVSPDDKARRGQEAVEVSRRSCELTQWKNGAFLDTLAAAYAECGKFKDAVKWQKRAVEVGLDDKLEEAKMHDRLHLYEEEKPYRLD